MNIIAAMNEDFHQLSLLKLVHGFVIAVFCEELHDHPEVFKNEHE